LPLSLFGIPGIGGVGDDTITNFNVPTYFYGGEAYNKIGVVSNGYIVIGGGDASDVNYYPQTFPNSARPNNVLAPFWTDLNPGASGAIRIGTLTDGTDNWIVVDFDHVRNFGNTNTHTGEIWIRVASGGAGTGPDSEELTIDYLTVGPSDPGSAQNSGAENRTGTSGQNFSPADGHEYRPVLSDPTPGGQATITFDVRGKRTGTYHSVASLTSDQTSGETQVSQSIEVTP
jgi:hypothetical protein